MRRFSTVFFFKPEHLDLDYAKLLFFGSFYLELGLYAFQYHVFLSDVSFKGIQAVLACNVTFHAFYALVILGLR